MPGGGAAYTVTKVTSPAAHKHKAKLVNASGFLNLFIDRPLSVIAVNGGEARATLASMEK